MTHVVVAFVSLALVTGSSSTASPGASAAPVSACPVLPSPPCRSVGDSVACRTSKGALPFPSISAFCLSCHGDGLHARSGDPGSMPSHPVDVAYPPPGREGYRPAAALGSALRLDHGRITCLTCHGGKDRETSHLSLPGSGSKLCLACHVR